MFNKKVNYLITLINFFTAMSWMVASKSLSTEKSFVIS